MKQITRYIYWPDQHEVGVEWVDLVEIDGELVRIPNSRQATNVALIKAFAKAADAADAWIGDTLASTVSRAPVLEDIASRIADGELGQ